MVDLPMLWTCTTVHRAHGRLISSVWRAVVLRRHLLGTWPSSRGVTQVIAAFALCDGGFVLELLCADDACLKRAACCLLCLRCRRLPSHEGHCRLSIWIFQCCGLVQQCIGYMVDCSAQCGALLVSGDICWERCHLFGGLYR